MVIIHALKLLLGQLGNAGALELLQSPADSLIAHEDGLADLSSGALNVMDLGSDEDGCTTEGRGATALAHPITLHALDELDGSEGNSLGLHS